MTEEPDFNKIAAEVAIQKLDSLIKSSRSVYGKLRNTIEIKLRSNYETDSVTFIEDYLFLKPFFFRSNPEYFYSFYVPIDVELASSFQIQT